MARRVAPLSLAEAACLSLIVESPRHGWSIVRDLAPNGSLGRIWTLSRPLTYRALEQLRDQGLVRAQREEVGRGPNRQILAATAAGRRALDAWIATPAIHLRDARTELLVKLAVRDRLGVGSAELLEAQLATYAPAVDLLRRRAAAAGSDRVDRWRARSAAATEAFLRSEWQNALTDN